MSLKIAIGGDHAGYDLKAVLIDQLEKDGHHVKDFGPYSDESVDYPDYVHPLATAVHSGEFDFGVAICGSGQGVTITANKHQGIRAALCWTPEIAGLARAHNNANVICLPARFIDVDVARKCVDTFLKEPFEGGRHERRVNKIDC